MHRSHSLPSANQAISCKNVHQLRLCSLSQPCLIHPCCSVKQDQYTTLYPFWNSCMRWHNPLPTPQRNSLPPQKKPLRLHLFWRKTFSIQDPFFALEAVLWSSQPCQANQAKGSTQCSTLCLRELWIFPGCTYRRD
ncbi:hypothetical protein V8G54_010717 [Vigna mungo]|uniref:Uncharacterized protein n=1 Tax=Vigna mungo TaxID=3915 RepID=A0AAQ3NXL9_VIGMU